MTQARIIPLQSAEKPVRPPHAIVLADVLAQVVQMPVIGGLVVAWSEPQLDGSMIYRVRTVGPDEMCAYVAQRASIEICTGALQRLPTPSDDPRSTGP